MSERLALLSIDFILTVQKILTSINPDEMPAYLALAAMFLMHVLNVPRHSFVHGRIATILLGKK